MTVRILVGDALDQLRGLADGSVRCCVTSPPYWSLRDYGVAGQLGLESTPAEYVAGMVAVFREVRRVLVDDGTLWLNLGDSYSGAVGSGQNDFRSSSLSGGKSKRDPMNEEGITRNTLLAPKNLVGIPWRVAFALQADGWYLRSDIIWSKPNPMPESVQDRPTKAHEYVFLLSKSATYYYDADAIAEPSIYAEEKRAGLGRIAYGGKRNGDEGEGQESFVSIGETRNARTVWDIATRPYADAHFATFPPELPRRCILAGSAIGDTILDPFGGAGTTGLVADRLNRNAVLIELNPKYAAMAEQRIRNDAPLFAEVTP